MPTNGQMPHYCNRLTSGGLQMCNDTADGTLWWKHQDGKVHVFGDGPHHIVLCEMHSMELRNSYLLPLGDGVAFSWERFGDPDVEPTKSPF